MAGTAMTSPFIVAKFDQVVGKFPIKSAEVINHGDLVGLDTNGSVVVADRGTPIHPIGVAVFTDERGGFAARTGVAGLTVKCAIARRARLSSLTTTLVPSLDDGKRVFLGVAPTATVSNYTCTNPQQFTAGDIEVPVGFALSPTTATINVDPSVIKYQASASGLANII